VKRQPAKQGPRYGASIELLRASEALWNAGRIFLEHWNLSPSQFNVLNLLIGLEGGCTQTELSRQLIRNRSNVTGLVDRLETRGLVQRLSNEADRRVFNVVITDKGAALMRQVYPHYYQAAEAVWGGMSVERAKNIAADVAAISANAGQIAVDATKNQKHPAAISDDA
jgi:DNA-binding MarR family transcriptional regulator